MNSRSILTVALCLGITLTLVSAADAQRGRQPSLNVGDQAPALNVSEWVQGGPVTFQHDKVYVINFWASWCGPCKRAKPRLNELYRRYSDEGLVIVGMNYEEDEDKVLSFMSGEGRRLDYPIAVDERSQTKRGWMDAAGLEGIPGVFIVDQRRRIQYIGNPLADDFVPVLQQVLSGRYDARLAEQAKPLIQNANRAREMRNWDRAMRHLDQIVAMDQRVFAPYSLVKFEILLLDMDERQAAYMYAQHLMQQYAHDTLFLADIAEKIARDPEIPDEKRELSVALRAAEMAAEQTKHSDPRMLSVLAMVHYEKGDHEKAVSLQRRAWMIASPDRKPGYQRTLNGYRDTASRVSQ